MIICSPGRRTIPRNRTRLQDDPPRSWDSASLGLAPAELRGDVFQDAFDHVCVVVHSERVRECHKQGICCDNRLVRGEFLDQYIGFTDIGAAKDGARVRVDEADLIAVAFLLPKLGEVEVVHERKDASADRHARGAAVSGFFQASRNASICLRCWMCSGSPLSSSLSVEL